MSTIEVIDDLINDETSSESEYSDLVSEATIEEDALVDDLRGELLLDKNLEIVELFSDESDDGEAEAFAEKKYRRLRPVS